MWKRPIPTVGDTTSAHQRALQPDGWAMSDSVVSALEEVIGARRDIRRYRPDPIPPDLVESLLRAAHAGPSVGHSQPWRFIVIDDAEIRTTAAHMADTEKIRQAELLSPERKSRLLDLQLDGIREAPLGIVVACDRRAKASGVLGRNTFTDSDLWSCAAAIENMWLTARAHGLGMGWVTLFQPDKLRNLLSIPEGVETLGWLCVGWPDERPPSPGLERRAWSRKLPLQPLIMRNCWTETPAPESFERTDTTSPVAAKPISDQIQNRAAAGSSGSIMPPQAHYAAARDKADRLLTPPESLGVLDTALNRMLAVGSVTAGPLIIAASDHPVADLGVTAFKSEVTREVLTATQKGESLGAATAQALGLEVITIDTSEHDIWREQGNIRDRAALPEKTTRESIAHGQSIAESLPEGQLIALGEIGVGNTTPAAILAARLCGLTPEETIGQGASADSAIIARKRDVARVALARTDTHEPYAVLSEFGGPEFAVLTGVCLSAPAKRHVIVLDGLATSVAALVATEINPAVQSHLVAGHLSRETAHRAVLTELGLEPLLSLRLRAGEGIGACYAASMLSNAARARDIAGETSAD